MASTYMDSPFYGDLYREMIDHAVRAEQLGFDSFWLGEHHFSYDGYCPANLTKFSVPPTSTGSIKKGGAASRPN